MSKNKENLETQCKLLCEECADNHLVIHSSSIAKTKGSIITYNAVPVFFLHTYIKDKTNYYFPCKASELRELYAE